MDSTLAIFTLFLPLLGGLCAGSFGPLWGMRFSQWVTCGCMGLATLTSLWLVIILGPLDTALSVPGFSWIHVGALEVKWGILIDHLSLVMIMIVTFISLMVHVYSIGYMKGEPGFSRFMAYLSFFTFFMLVLVTAPNFVQLFFGWEGVGLSSYLLIGYWYNDPRANRAAFKAFLMNRIGDVGYVLGILTLYLLFQTFDFSPIFTGVPDKQAHMIEIYGWQCHTLTLATILLFVGAMGKSAQVGLHTWLPDAMEAPTPVSALLHAATMVTAGVFLMVRISPLLDYTPLTREMITIVGAATVVLAASIACVQNDIKRIIAYSTGSQLGYMFMAIGLSGYSAAMFHLTTHAFFKATLFLGAGSVIHAMSDEQDIQKMGGIWRAIPITYTLMWIGSLALAGLPFFAGFYSKDLILEINWVSKMPVAFACGLVGIVLTAFYAWRLLILTFQGTPRANDAVMSHLKESPLSMLVPLISLGLITLVVGPGLYTLFVGSFFGPQNEVILAAQQTSYEIKTVPVLATLLGIGVAYLFYMRSKKWPSHLEMTFKRTYEFFFHQCYIDALYDRLFVVPSLKLANLLWKEGDQKGIESLGPKGLTTLSLLGGRLICRLQTGYLYHAAFAMVLGFGAMVGGILWLNSDTLRLAEVYDFLARYKG